MVLQNLKITLVAYPGLRHSYINVDCPAYSEKYAHAYQFIAVLLEEL